MGQNDFGADAAKHDTDSQQVDGIVLVRQDEGIGRSDPQIERDGVECDLPVIVQHAANKWFTLLTTRLVHGIETVVHMSIVCAQTYIYTHTKYTYHMGTCVARNMMPMNQR